MIVAVGEGKHPNLERERVLPQEQVHPREDGRLYAVLGAAPCMGRAPCPLRGRVVTRERLHETFASHRGFERGPFVITA